MNPTVKGLLSLVQDCLISFENDKGERVGTRIAACWSAPGDKETHYYNYYGGGYKFSKDGQ